jgi:hypothetical protein
MYPELGDIFKDLSRELNSAPSSFQERLKEYSSRGIKVENYEAEIFRYIISNNYFEHVDVFIKFMNEICENETGTRYLSIKGKLIGEIDILTFIEHHVNGMVSEIKGTHSPSTEYSALLYKYEQVKKMILKIVKYINANLSYDFPVV